jgi:hypothetical protein
MGLLDRLRRKKKGQKDTLKEETAITDLEKLCADDKESYEALRGIMFLDPRKIETPLTDVVKTAEESEKQGDTLKAKISYEIAGGLAIYKGDAAKVKEYFEKCQKLSPNTVYPILRNPRKAVKKAQEYYQKYLA